MKDIFRALQYRNYRLFFGGQCISLIGTWLQWVALSWLVYALTNSALLLGVVGFSGQIAVFLLSPFAGVFVDRWNRHRMIVATQTLAMLQAFVLSALVLTHRINVWEIICLSVFMGIVNGFDMPARQAFVVYMVDKKEDLSNAIALNSSMFNVARLIGPAIAGFIIGMVGAGVCFFLNGVSYLAVIIALLAMRVPKTTADGPKRHPVRELKEGFTYTFGFIPLRSVIIMLGVMSLLGSPYAVLMPIFAKKILHGGPSTLGLLMGSSGVGALIGAFFLASRKSVLGLGRWIAISAGIFGAGLIGFSFSKSLWLSLIILSVIGFAAITQMAASNTIIQTIVEDKLRGRVMSWYATAFIGMAPFGSLLGGGLAHRFGAPHTVLFTGLFAVMGGVVFAAGLPALRKHVRPIYAAKGIITEAATGA